MADNTVAQHSLHQASPRRIVTLDIETVSLDPADTKGALDAITGRIACIGLLFDDGAAVTPAMICDLDERKLLERFWAALTASDVLVGHNILAFDLMFIRSWILGVKPPIALNLKKYYTDQVVDLMELWTNWSNRFKGCGLDAIAAALGCGSKSGHGSEVAALWANRQFTQLMDYCMGDVWLSYLVYCRMHYREPLAFSLPQELRTSSSALAAPQAPEYAPAQLDLVPVQAQSIAAHSSGAVIPSATRNLNGASPASCPRRPRKGSSPKEILCVRQDRILILSGNTFPIKDDLKQRLGAHGRKDEAGKYEWHLPVANYDALLHLCSSAGIRLLHSTSPAGLSPVAA